MGVKAQIPDKAATIKWRSMMNRCYNKKQEAYKKYGAKGITVAPEWHDIKVFYADMGSPPPGYTLERNDNSKGYSKANCRWASWADQQANRRHVQKLPDGRVAARVAKENGISADCFHRRVHRGLSLEEAATLPIGYRWSQKRNM